MYMVFIDGEESYVGMSFHKNQIDYEHHLTRYNMFNSYRDLPITLRIPTSDSDKSVMEIYYNREYEADVHKNISSYNLTYSQVYDHFYETLYNNMDLIREKYLKIDEDEEELDDDGDDPREQYWEWLYNLLLTELTFQIEPKRNYITTSHFRMI